VENTGIMGCKIKAMMRKMTSAQAAAMVVDVVRPDKNMRVAATAKALSSKKVCRQKKERAQRNMNECEYDSEEEAKFAALRSAGMQKRLGEKKNLGVGASDIPEDKLAKEKRPKDPVAAGGSTEGKSSETSYALLRWSLAG
jgi:hypothetical protein